MAADESAVEVTSALLAEWVGHHYRSHGGDLLDCPSKTCQRVVERMTDPGAVTGRTDREGFPCPSCGHRLSAYDWCPACLAHQTFRVPAEAKDSGRTEGER